MRGLGSRERNGLIVFCCFVIFFLAIGPVADRLGCTGNRSSTVPVETKQVNLPVTVEAPSDSVVASGDEAQPVRIGSKERRKEKGDTTVRKRKSRKAASRAMKTREAPRRSYLDEPL